MLRDFVDRLNKTEDKIMWLVAPCGVLIGLILGNRIQNLAFLGSYMFMIMTFTGAISMEAREFLNVMKHPKALVVYFFVVKLFIPFFCTMITRLILPGMEETIFGFILIFTGPIAVTSFIWSGIHKGDGSLALTLIMLDTIITPLSMPLYTKLLLGTSIAIDSGKMMLSLLQLVVIPMILGIGANRISRNKLKNIYSPYFKPVGKLAMVLSLIFSCCKIGDEVAMLKASDWPMAATAILSVAVSALVGYSAARLIKLDRSQVVTLTFTSGLRNNTASLLIAITLFSAKAALPVVILILFQQTIMSWLGAMLFEWGKKTGISDSAGNSRTKRDGCVSTNVQSTGS